MTKAEIFHKVKEHLLTQKKRAYSNNFCVLRNNRGLKCAIGCLIPDDLLDLTQRNDLQDLALVRPIRKLLGLGNEKRIDFLYGFQRIRDLVDPEDWGMELERLRQREKIRG